MSKNRLTEFTLFIPLAGVTAGLIVSCQLARMPRRIAPDADWVRGANALHSAAGKRLVGVETDDDFRTSVRLEFEGGQSVVILGVPELAVGVER